MPGLLHLLVSQQQCMVWHTLVPRKCWSENKQIQGSKKGKEREVKERMPEIWGAAPLLT